MKPCQVGSFRLFFIAIVNTLMSDVKPIEKEKEKPRKSKKIKGIKDFVSFDGILTEELWSDKGVAFPSALMTKFKKYKQTCKLIKSMEKEHHRVSAYLGDNARWNPLQAERFDETGILSQLLILLLAQFETELKEEGKTLPPEETKDHLELSENDAERQTAFSQEQFRRAKIEKQEQLSSRIKRDNLEIEQVRTKIEQREKPRESSRNLNRSRMRSRERSRSRTAKMKSISRSRGYVQDGAFHRRESRTSIVEPTDRRCRPASRYRRRIERKSSVLPRRRRFSQSPDRRARSRPRRRSANYDLARRRRSSSGRRRRSRSRSRRYRAKSTAREDVARYGEYSGGWRNDRVTSSS